MMRGIFEQATEVVSSDDLKETYEVTRRWQDGAGKMLVLELYPTIAADRPGELDLSAMHLMNHIHQLGGYGEARVMNLFPIVCRNGKPLSKRLKESTENLAYIEEAFDRAKEEGTDIVIAWGTAWKDLAAARSVKMEILEMVKEKGLADKTFHIVTPDLDTHDQEGTHPLYLGLRWRKSIHNGNGLPGEGRCDIKGIVQWRMDYQWKLILDRIWNCPEQTLDELYGEIRDNYELPTGTGDAEGKIEQLQKRKERQERRLDILLEKLMEEVITDAVYQTKKKEVEEQIRIISDDIQALTGDSCPVQMMPEEKVKRNLEEIKSVLDSYTRSVTEEIPSTDLIDKFVVRVTALEDGSFRWYLNFGKEIPYDEAFDEKYYQLIDKFEAGFEEAKEYRRSTGHFIRRNQWRDLDVEVYLYTGSSSLDMER